MLMRALMCGTLVCATVGAALQANAHSWYPKECCSNRDCQPAAGLYSDARGDTIVRVGRQQFLVPPDLRRRPSPDGRIHVCIQYDEFGLQYPVCLFVPASPRTTFLGN